MNYKKTYFKKILLYSVLFFIITIKLFANTQKPFQWNTLYSKNNKTISVSVQIQKGYYLYANQTIVKVFNNKKNILPIKQPQAESYIDNLGSHQIYSGGKTVYWIYSVLPNMNYEIHLEYQGCKIKTQNKPAMCLLPSSENFNISTKEKSQNTIKTTTENYKKNKSNQNTIKLYLNSLFDSFKTIKTAGGYIPPEDFISFLNYSDKNNINTSSKFQDLPVNSFFALIFIIIIGGMALNLTPCILPMIPINLAIIGAGSATKSKTHGFIRGGIYGLGIALSYGILGIVTVLTGSKFGSLNSSPAFNYLIATIFIILSLGMFGVISIDLSRFSSSFYSTKKKSHSIQLLAVFFMGVIVALLAGACVAPVIIAVLLYSATLFADGNSFAILLPFLLGIGMGIPWPFIGSGIAMIPKPGAWMVKIKYAFGIFILIFAGYYFYIATTLHHDTKQISSSFENLESQLLKAKKLNKPVFIDFWATWCSNCKKMEAVTFKNPEVQKQLKNFIVIKFQAENINDPKTKMLLDRFNIPGLPAFVILK
jgi:thiol:disulfide interchange protein